ncbi:MAG: lamin tail domain-containing protein [Candidatus Aminicenantes bacterium]|nr:lamin tail domain-containing protein [Candidatus Aminicenantes bacterium]
MKKISLRKLIPTLLIVMILTVFSSAMWAQNLEIHYINVQQGQSTLIIGPDGTTLLYDGGYEFKGTTEVIPYLQSIGIDTSQAFDYVIASHMHTDHFMGLTETMNYGYDALNVYVNGSDYYNVYVQDFFDAADGTTAGGVTTMALGQTINLGGGATATCVAVDGSVIGVGAIPDGQLNENDRSICLLIQYGDFDFLVTGDVGGGSDDYECTGRSTSQVNIETPLVQAIMPGGAYPMLSSYGVEVAHVSHHGSESSTNSDYMNLLTPAIAPVCVGDNQGSGWYHPRIDVVENVLLAQAVCVTAPPALVLQTQEGDPAGSTTSFAGYCVGDIVITTDGLLTYNVSATGAVSSGPDERSAAGLPAAFNLDENTSGDPAPIISNVHTENVTLTSADIAWTTNETADSLVRYGTASGSYTDTVSDATMVYTHSLPLTGLTENTTYYYQVESTDAGSNTTTSMEYSFTTASTGSGGTVMFSEVFYDTPGTDAIEEWFEIYNDSGSTVDLSGWTITDNNGTGGTYTFPGGTSIAAGTYLTVAADSAGFNALYGFDADLYGTLPALNNDGDTLILKDGSAVEVDAVAWEGGATAGIPATWGSATDPIASTGSSIYRLDFIDTDSYADWGVAGSNGDPQTQGSGPSAPAIVFSEIFYDTPGTDADEEWIELYNNSGSAVDVGGWTISDNNGEGATYTFPLGTTIAAGAYFTVAHNSAGFNAIYGYDADLYGSIPLLNNDGDTLLLEDGSAVLVDAVAWEGGAAAGIPGDWGSSTDPSAPTGSSIYRTNPLTDSGSYTDWAVMSGNGDPQTQAMSGPPAVVFSEIFYDTPGTDADEEWIELYNNTASTIDIGGWTITDNNGTGTTYTFPAGTTIAAGTYLTAAHDSTGFNALYGFDADLYGSIPLLNNDGETLILKNDSAEEVDAVAWEGGATAGIPVGWGSVTDPTAPTGSSIYRTNPLTDSDTYTDWAVMGSNGDPQTQSGGGDTTPPVISGVVESAITTNSATIGWTTDEDSDSEVLYGTSPGNYTGSSYDNSMVTGHSLNLTNLTPDTTYYYVVKSTDASNNTATSAEYSFTSEAVVIEYMINTISLSATTVRGKTTPYATITVTSNGSPVEGAVVDVTWSGSVPGTDSDTTDSNGQITFSTKATRDDPYSFTITVNGITKTGYLWDSGGSEISDTIGN